MRWLITAFIAVCVLSLLQTSSSAWECEVDVFGPKTIKLGQQVTLSASGTPAGGSYSWSRTPNLITNGSTAILIGFNPTFSDYIKVTGYYTSPKGKKCSDSIWLWACVCSPKAITAPAKAKIGEEVTLSIIDAPEGGTYSWNIESGSGILTTNGASATFIGDKIGVTEIRLSYIPPEGGEPCSSFKKIEIVEDCSISINELYRRPVCRPETMQVTGIPSGGSCLWAGDGISDISSCETIYNSSTPGESIITATYTTPNGQTCDASHTILSYKLDAISSVPVCFNNGAVLSFKDFNIYTSPAEGSFRDTLSFTPQVVSTLLQEQQVLVEGAFLCPNKTNVKTTVVTVINKNIKDSFTLKIDVPNYIKKPLEIVGLDENANLAVVGTYESSKECCISRVAHHKSGQSTISMNVGGEGTIFGIPLPKSIKNYVSADALKATLSGGGKVQIKADYGGCTSIETVWSGGGYLSVTVGIGGEVKVKIDQDVFVIKGALGGESSISQSIAAKDRTLLTNSKWGGLSVKGQVVLSLWNEDIISESVDWEVLKPDELHAVPVSFPLPSLE